MIEPSPTCRAAAFVLLPVWLEGPAAHGAVGNQLAQDDHHLTKNQLTNATG